MSLSESQTRQKVNIGVIYMLYVKMQLMGYFRHRWKFLLHYLAVIS